MEEAQVLINSAYCFRGGSHERIWFGMAKGCVLYTDQTSFMNKTFVEEESILYINNGDLTTEFEWYLNPGVLHWIEIQGFSQISKNFICDFCNKDECAISPPGVKEMLSF